MANAIPLLEGTAASGGYLVPDGQNGLTFDKGILRRSAVLSAPGLRRQVVNGKREKYTEYVGRPTVATVAEGADKPATGAELAELTLDIVKAAGVVMLTEELIEDAGPGLLQRIDADIREAFAEYIDQNALGRNAAGTIVGSFNTELEGTTSSVELGGTGDALAVAISSAMNTIEAAGYNPTAVIAANDVSAHIRNARSAVDATMPLYVDGFQANPGVPNIFGLPILRTTNLSTFSGAAAAGRIVAIVGDFSQALFAVRNDIRRKVSDQATIDVSGTAHRLWQQNKLGVLWEMRCGFVAHDLNNAFVKIANAS